jgi:hypothetical protein
LRGRGILPGPRVQRSHPVKEAQAAPLVPAFQRHLEKGQIAWLDELLPPYIPGRTAAA